MFGRRSPKASDNSPPNDLICADWACQMDRFGQGETIDINSLEPLPESADKDAVKQVAQSCFGAVGQRLQGIDERFQKSVKAANDWRIYERSLVHVRTELRSLHCFIADAPLPDQVAMALMTEFRRAVDQLQATVDSGAHERARTTGDQSMLMATRTRIAVFDDAESTLPAPEAPAVPRTIRLGFTNG